MFCCWCGCETGICNDIMAVHYMYGWMRGKSLSGGCGCESESEREAQDLKMKCKDMRVRTRGDEKELAELTSSSRAGN